MPTLERKPKSGGGPPRDAPTPTTTAAGRSPSRPFPIPSLPALNVLISALENSPPENESPETAYGAVSSLHADAASAASARIHISVDATPIVTGDGDGAKASSGKKQKKRRADDRGGGRKKPTVSDDDDANSGRKRTKLEVAPTLAPLPPSLAPLPPSLDPPKRSPPPPPPTTTNEPSRGSVASMDDLASTIDEAAREGRIDEKKAERLGECLRAGDWSEVAFSLLCEQIPLKRKGRGYSCRVCSVPKKGHNCPYCHVCSTPEEKFRKDDDHVCVNCPTCFEDGKRRKKLVQIRKEGHVCPFGPADGDETLPKRIIQV